MDVTIARLEGNCFSRDYPYPILPDAMYRGSFLLARGRNNIQVDLSIPAEAMKLTFPELQYSAVVSRISFDFFTTCTIIVRHDTCYDKSGFSSY